MNVRFMVSREATENAPVGHWILSASWPMAEAAPGKGWLVKLDGSFMRVAEVCQTGPFDVDVYVIPAHIYNFDRIE